MVGLEAMASLFLAFGQLTLPQDLCYCFQIWSEKKIRKQSAIFEIFPGIYKTTHSEHTQIQNLLIFFATSAWVGRDSQLGRHMRAAARKYSIIYVIIYIIYVIYVVIYIIHRKKKIATSTGVGLEAYEGGWWEIRLPSRVQSPAPPPAPPPPAPPAPPAPPQLQLHSTLPRWQINQLFCKTDETRTSQPSISKSDLFTTLTLNSGN